MYFPLFVGVLCLSLFCYALLCVHSSFAIILKSKRKLVALLLLSYRCSDTINVLWLFLTVTWVGLQCMIVAFPDHTDLLLKILLMCTICGRKKFYRNEQNCLPPQEYPYLFETI